MGRLLLWLLLSFRLLVADDSTSDSGDSDLGSSDSGGSDSDGSTSDAAGTNSIVLSSSGDEADSSGSGERRRPRRNARPVRQDGTPDPTTLSPDDYRDIPLS